MTQEKGIPYRRHKPSAALREFLDPLDPGSYFDCGQARLDGLDEALLREAESRGRAIGDDSFQLVATDMGLIYCRPSISFAIAARWDEVTLIRPRGDDPVVLTVSWPTHGELKFTVSKRLAGNVFRRWLQLRMQAERLARREKAERFNLKPTQDAARQQRGDGAGEGTPVAGEDDWEVVTRVEPPDPKPQDAVMQAMPDRRDHAVAAQRRRKNNVGKAKQRLRREGSTVSMPPEAIDGDRVTESKTRPGTTGVPKPVRQRQRTQSPGSSQAAPDPSQNSDATEPLDLAPPVPPVPTPARVPRMPVKPSEPLGSPTGAEVTNYLPAPPTPAKTGAGPATPADLASADTSSPQALDAVDDSTGIAESDPPDPLRPPTPANPSAPVGSPLAEVTNTTTMIGRPLNVAPLVHAEQLAHSEQPADDSSTDPTTDLETVPDREPSIDLTGDAARNLTGNSTGYTDRLGDVDGRVATQPSWIGSPVSIVGAMVVISTFVLITATATASYRRSVQATESTDSTDAGLAGPAISVRTTIDHQRFNPSADAAVPLGPSGSMPQDSLGSRPATTADAGTEIGGGGGISTEALVEPLDGGPTQASVVEGAPRLCNSNYSGCVPDVSDVDCPGDGDGPLYSTEPAVVMGQDVYGLDTDGDGETCEPDQPPHAQQSHDSSG